MCSAINVDINVKVSDLPLTPFTCAVLVNEIIKYLIYEKCQIPYTYYYLKSLIKEAKNISETVTNITTAKHYQNIVAAYDTLENIMLNISSEFKSSENVIKRVLIIFGATPYCAKQVYSIKIPLISHDHVESNHAQAVLKHQHKILQ